jgi:hypothetical protein
MRRTSWRIHPYFEMPSSCLQSWRTTGCLQVVSVQVRCVVVSVQVRWRICQYVPKGVRVGASKNSDCARARWHVLTHVRLLACVRVCARARACVFVLCCVRVRIAASFKLEFSLSQSGPFIAWPISARCRDGGRPRMETEKRASGGWRTLAA